MNKQYMFLIAYFAISRMVMALLGFRINVDYSFMHFHDIVLLTNNFWETIFYTHAFTPWINILVGAVLRFPESSHLVIYQVFFYLMSLISVLSFYRILLRLDLPKYIGIGVVVFFTLTPAYIYFEHFLGYTFPSMVMLLLLINSFDIALKKDTFSSWLLFFSFCTFLCFIRTTFHYVWLISVFFGVILLIKRIDFKVLSAFLVPSALLATWYIKNLIVFGFFGASSWSGFNLAFTTTKSLSPSETEILVDKGTLSPLAAIPIYSGIESYADHVDLSKKIGIDVLDDQRKQMPQNAINFNHHSYIELSRLKMKDNLAFISEFPFRYFKRVLAGHVQFFGPSTRWHPHDKYRSPHIPLREKIGVWENFYNGLIHFNSPLKQMGLYLIIGLILAYYFFRSVILLVRWKDFGSNEKLQAFLIMNIFYVMFLSCLVTIGELSRYRFMIEPFIWILIILFIKGRVLQSSTLDFLKQKEL